MKKESNKILIFTIKTISVSILLFTSSCFLGHDLRGKVKQSKDHKTYLLIREKDNENCLIYIDDEIWPYKVGVKGEIKPGTHEIKGGGQLTIEIKEGTTFIFNNYWGP
jgi:hypothetical protein